VIVCGLQIGHIPSVCLVQDGKLIYYNEERKLAQVKNVDGLPYKCLEDIKTFKIDEFMVTSYNHNNYELNILRQYLNYIKLLKDNEDVLCLYYPHHIAHLFKAYYDSGFKDARVFVIDGRGSDWYLDNNLKAYETCSVYDVIDGQIKCIYKKLYCKLSKVNKVNKNFNPDYNLSDIQITPLFVEDTKFEIDDHLDLGNFYAKASEHFNFKHEEGKFMGLTAYGKANDDCFKELKNDNLELLELNVDNAATVQKYFENNYLVLVKKFKYKNMIFTGGTALNVVNNYKIKKQFEDCSLYFEPLCGDEGNSIGTAYLYNHLHKIENIQNKTLYIGSQINNFNDVLDENEKFEENIDINKIIKLLNKGNVIGLVQGKAEAGPRALGNRSLLLDPTLSNCKDIMNLIKRRERFRPFACSVLEEEKEKYFDLNCSSPFMMLAPQATDKAKKEIPGLIHIDNTCRVQTVNEEQNKILYLLLKNFKIPVLMNTSLNLAGYPMVETFKDILFSVRNSSLKYVYFADYKKLLIKN
jgi:carbamoyltransferase